jgi:hypothetical protein
MRAPAQMISLTILVAGGVAACHESPLSILQPDSPSAPFLRPQLSVAVAYSRVRANPNSPGRIHNRNLDEIHRLVLLKREQLGNRRLNGSQYCEVLSGYVRAGYAAHGQSADLGPLSLPLQAGTCTITRPAPRRGRFISLESVETDFIDSVFALTWDDTTWFDPAMPTIEETHAALDDFGSLLETNLASIDSVEDISDAISDAVVGMGTLDSTTAALVADAADVASSSAEYWTENLDEWMDDFCMDQSLVALAGHGPAPLPRTEQADTEEELCGDGDPPAARFLFGTTLASPPQWFLNCWEGEFPYTPYQMVNNTSCLVGLMVERDVESEWASLVEVTSALGIAWETIRYGRWEEAAKAFAASRQDYANEIMDVVAVTPPTVIEIVRAAGRWALKVFTEDLGVITAAVSAYAVYQDLK